MRREKAHKLSAHKVLGQKSRRRKVPRIFRMFIPNFAPQHAPSFPRSFKRLFCALFPGVWRHLNLPRISAIFLCQMPGKSIERIHKSCLKSRQSDKDSEKTVHPGTSIDFLGVEERSSGRLSRGQPDPHREQIVCVHECLFLSLPKCSQCKTLGFESEALS